VGASTEGDDDSPFPESFVMFVFARYGDKLFRVHCPCAAQNQSWVLLRLFSTGALLATVPIRP